MAVTCRDDATCFPLMALIKLSGVTRRVARSIVGGPIRNGRFSTVLTTLHFGSEAFDLDSLLRGVAPETPSFVYERASTRTREPLRTFIGFGRVADGPATAGADAFAGLRTAIGNLASSPDGAQVVLAFLSYEALVGSEAAADTPGQLHVTPALLVDIDHETGEAKLTGQEGALQEAVRAALGRLRPGIPPTGGTAAGSAEEAVSAWTHNQTEAEFIANAAELQREMAARPDVTGAALSVELSSTLDVSPLAAYRVLRRINPSTCMFFVQDGAFALWGATSLPVLSLDGQRLVAETDGATRRVDPGETAAWVPNSKEMAEYDLVVSALRDDLRGVVDEASLRFVADREARQYFNLQHLFAEIEGELVAGVDAVEALRRLTPHGAATGYAKRGAVALIDRYDARPRGPYAGAIGVFGSDGSADAACVIRSAWKVGAQIRTRAGAKIVAGSDPAAEYQESVLKTLPLRRSVALAMGT